VDDTGPAPVPPDPVRGIELPTHLERIRRPLPAPVLHAARFGVRQVGVLTAAQRPLPDFLIIGAKKAGTSSLMNWLLRHSAVARMFPSAQRLKSPHYFDVNYWRGERWYRSHFPTRQARHRQELHSASPSVAGEASPYYLFHPAVPARVARDLPQVKVIVLLRDPVARAYSNFWDRRAAGAETLTSFEDALAVEAERLSGVDHERLQTDPRYYSFDHDNHSYLARGRYLEHLRAWLEGVAAERMLVLRAEAMFAEPGLVFAQTQRFLGIPVTDDVPLRPYNERSREPMQPATKARLADYYRPHNAALYAALGTDMGWEEQYPH